jgi:hypothetical protein
MRAPLRLLPALLMAVSAAAHAGSRLVVQMTEGTRVYIDGVLVVNNGTGRAVINQLPAGAHRVEVHSDKGALLGSHTLQVQDGVEVQLRVAPDGALSSDGAAVRAAPKLPATPPPGGPGPQPAPQANPQNNAPVGASGESAPPRGAGQSVAQDAVVQSNANDQPETPGSFDLNEGSAGGASTGQSSASRDWSAATTTASRLAGSGVGAAVIPIPGVGSAVGGAVGGVVAPRVVNGAANVVRNAEAGGLNDYRRAEFRQGRPVPPKAITGTLVFQGAEPMLVFLEGFLIGTTTPERPVSKTKLEIGRHALELRDPSGVNVLYRGVVVVEKDQTLTLAWGPGEPPHALERSWNWSPR